MLKMKRSAPWTYAINAADLYMAFRWLISSLKQACIKIYCWWGRKHILMHWTQLARAKPELIFGDGAGAVVLQATKNENQGILSTHLHSDGSEAEIFR